MHFELVVEAEALFKLDQADPADHGFAGTVHDGAANGEVDKKRHDHDNDFVQADAASEVPDPTSPAGSRGRDSGHRFSVPHSSRVFSLPAVP